MCIYVSMYAYVYIEVLQKGTKKCYKILILHPNCNSPKNKNTFCSTFFFVVSFSAVSVGNIIYR